MDRQRFKSRGYFEMIPFLFFSFENNSLSNGMLSMRMIFDSLAHTVCGHFKRQEHWRCLEPVAKGVLYGLCVRICTPFSIPM